MCAVAQVDVFKQGSGRRLRARAGRGGKEAPDAPTEVALTEDLSGSMRLLKPEGQVAADRFASLLRRNRFEAGKEHAPGKKKGRFKLRERYRVGEKSTQYDRARIMALDARS